MIRHASRWGRRALCRRHGCAVGTLLLCGAQALGVTQLNPGDPAPAFSLAGEEGKTVTVPDPRGEVQVLLFGDSTNAEVEGRSLRP